MLTFLRGAAGFLVSAETRSSMMSFTRAPRLVFASILVFWPGEGFDELGAVGLATPTAADLCRLSCGAVGLLAAGAGVGAGLLGRRSSMMLAISERSGAAPDRLRASAAGGAVFVVAAAAAVGVGGVGFLVLCAASEY